MLIQTSVSVLNYTADFTGNQWKSVKWREWAAAVSNYEVISDLEMGKIVLCTGLSNITWITAPTQTYTLPLDCSHSHRNMNEHIALY